MKVKTIQAMTLSIRRHHQVLLDHYSQTIKITNEEANHNFYIYLNFHIVLSLIQPP